MGEWRGITLHPSEASPISVNGSHPQGCSLTFVGVLRTGKAAAAVIHRAGTVRAVLF